MLFNEIRMIWFFIAAVLLTSCQNNQDISKIADGKTKITSSKENKAVLKVTDTYSVDGIKFQLLQYGDTAKINIESKGRIIQGELKLSPPCYFVKRWGEVQSFAYPDVGVEYTLIVLGDTVGIDRKKYFGMNEEADFSRICGEGIQGVLIKKDSIIVSERVLDGGFTCLDSGRDEKDFWDFAHTRRTVENARKLRYRYNVKV